MPTIGGDACASGSGFSNRLLTVWCGLCYLAWVIFRSGRGVCLTALANIVIVAVYGVGLLVCLVTLCGSVVFVVRGEFLLFVIGICTAAVCFMVGYLGRLGERFLSKECLCQHMRLSM